jgi:hypothetical protein
LAFAAAHSRINSSSPFGSGLADMALQRLDLAFDGVGDDQRAQSATHVDPETTALSAREFPWGGRVWAH